MPELNCFYYAKQRSAGYHLTAELNCTMAQVLAQWTAQFGSVFKWNLAGTTILVITDPDEVYKLCSRDANLGKPRIMYKLLNPVRVLLLQCWQHVCTKPGKRRVAKLS